jgi:HlyD family secretion protein
VASYPGEAFEGTVSQVRLQPAVGTVVTYTVIVDVSNPDERLRPGMTATVAIATSPGAARESRRETP